jgi:hypothetical protein
MCELLLHCDPLEPTPYCEYAPQFPCDPPAAGDTCLDLCEPLTPNGCDCWGCCTLEIAGEPQSVHLLDSDCSSDAPEACPACTQHMELCGNPCDPEACEICIGQTEPPAGCNAAGCDGTQPCASSCDCEAGGYCLQGCCHPAPPG